MRCGRIAVVVHVILNINVQVKEKKFTIPYSFIYAKIKETKWNQVKDEEKKEIKKEIGFMKFEERSKMKEYKRQKKEINKERCEMKIEKRGKKEKK